MEWTRLVERFDEALYFHSWDWLDLQERLLGVVFERLVAYDDDGTAVGIFPVPRVSRQSPRGFGPPFPFLGPLVPVEHLPDTLRALRRWQLSTRLLTGRLEFRSSVAEIAAEPVREAGLRISNKSTVVVDVSHGSTSALMGGYSSLRRRDIRRAIRDGGSVRPARANEIATLMPRVMQEAFATRGATSPLPISTGRMVEEFATGRTDIGLFTALVHDEPVGIQVVLGGRTTALAWVGASLRRYRSVNVNALLYHRLLEWAIEQGCREVDLCGDIDEGVLKYKLAFGGHVRPWLVAESSLIPGGLSRHLRSVRARGHRIRR